MSAIGRRVVRARRDLDEDLLGHLHLAVAPHAPRERHVAARDVHLDPPGVDLGVLPQVLDDDVVDLVVRHGGEVVQVGEVVPRHSAPVHV